MISAIKVATPNTVKRRSTQFSTITGIVTIVTDAAAISKGINNIDAPLRNDLNIIKNILVM